MKWQQTIEHKANTELAGTCVSILRSISKDKCCIVLQVEMKEGELKSDIAQNKTNTTKIEGTKWEVFVLKEGVNRAVNNKTAKTVTRDVDTTVKPKDLLLDLTIIYELVGKLMSKAEFISYSEEENHYENEISMIQTITTMLKDFDDFVGISEFDESGNLMTKGMSNIE